MTLTDKGYTVAHNVSMVTREEWRGWFIPLPSTMNDSELEEYLHDFSNEMSNFILSLQAIRSNAIASPRSGS